MYSLGSLSLEYLNCRESLRLWTGIYKPSFGIQVSPETTLSIYNRSHKPDPKDAKVSLPNW